MMHDPVVFDEVRVCPGCLAESETTGSVIAIKNGAYPGTELYLTKNVPGGWSLSRLSAVRRSMSP